MAVTVAAGSSTPITRRAYRSSARWITTALAGSCTSQNTRSPWEWKVPATITPGTCAWAAPSFPAARHLRVGLDTGDVRQGDVQLALEGPQLVHALDLDAQQVAGDLDSRHVPSLSVRGGSGRLGANVSASGPRDVSTIMSCGPGWSGGVGRGGGPRTLGQDRHHRVSGPPELSGRPPAGRRCGFRSRTSG